ncbi:MAG TPA: hypothetical protein VMS64_01760 [Candidatus Methylomirabilis sp.]|nr:hypothetical protein [Candidatus Methylomirabilis sp.]
MRSRTLVALGASTLVIGPQVAAGSEQSAVGASAEEITLRLPYQLIAILVATRLVIWGVRRLWQTDVSGEILVGLLLGPSLLGAIFPHFMHQLFHPSTGVIFSGRRCINIRLYWCAWQGSNLRPSDSKFFAGHNTGQPYPISS